MKTWKFCDYDQITTVTLGLGHVPPETSASVLVEGVKMLREIPARLDNPVIHVGKGELLIKGSINSLEFFCYDGGDSVIVYDKNWNKLRQLAVEKKDYQASLGGNDIKISVANLDNLPWLEVQFLTENTPIVVNKK
jgi:hypothetical protein